MRSHRDGYIQCQRVEVWLPAEAVRRARSVGVTLGEGLEREVELYLGLEIDGALRCRLTGSRGEERLAAIESDWVAPTKR